MCLLKANLMKKMITLQFKSPELLWNFRIAALIDFLEMDAAKCLLTCDCSAQQLELAVKTYKAIVVVEQEC